MGPKTGYASKYAPDSIPRSKDPWDNTRRDNRRFRLIKPEDVDKFRDHPDLSKEEVKKTLSELWKDMESNQKDTPKHVEAIDQLLLLMSHVTGNELRGAPKYQRNTGFAKEINNVVEKWVEKWQKLTGSDNSGMDMFIQKLYKWYDETDHLVKYEHRTPQRRAEQIQKARKIWERIKKRREDAEDDGDAEDDNDDEHDQKIKRENTTKNLEDLFNNMESTLESLKEQERKSGYSSCSEDQIEQITNEATKVALAYLRLSMRLLVHGYSEEQIQRQANRAQSSGESALTFLRSLHSGNIV